MIFDSHTHLYWRSFDDDRTETLARARAAGVERLMVIGTDVDSSKAALELAHSDPNIWASVGIHPNDLDPEQTDEAALAAIVELSRDERCVAIGETGLDYYWDRVPKERQLEGFRWHLELAAAVHKPVVVHSRDAHEDTKRVLQEFLGGDHPGGVMHCFTMGAEEAVAYTALDMYISFSGVVTYPKNEGNRQAALAVATDRLLVETDSPFLPPQPWRGKRNEPAHVAHVVERLADLRGVSKEELAETTAQNAARLFGLPA